MQFSDLIKEVLALPAYKGKPIENAAKAATYLAIAKFGPKLDVLTRETGQAPSFLHDRIEWLKDNQCLTTGSLSRKYLDPYFPQGGHLIDAYLGGENGRSSSTDLDVMSLSLPELDALVKQRKLDPQRYSKMSLEDRKIWNRRCKLRKAARENGETVERAHRPTGSKPGPKPKAQSAEKDSRQPQKPLPEPISEPESDHKPVIITDLIAYLEKQAEKLNADIAALKRTHELINEIELPGEAA